MVNIIKTFRPLYRRGYAPTRMFFMSCLLFAISTILPSTGLAANSLSQFGITWTFDKELSTDGAGGTYQYGQFANGDYWVVGPVTIVGIDPPSFIADGVQTMETGTPDEWTPEAGRTVNGAMVNPDPTVSDQGYDSAMPTVYDSNLNQARPGGSEVNDVNPLTVEPNTSLISIISREPEPLGYFNYPLKTAAILTVLPSAPSAGNFRPPYVGTDKTIKFNKNQLAYNLLGTLSPTANVPILHKDVLDDPNVQGETVERMFMRPWLDHLPKGEDNIHPKQNMPGYPGDMGKQVGIAALMLNCDYSNEQKETLVIALVQFGIDSYAVVSNGGIENWIGHGGHGAGRKFPIVFAGAMLNDSDMKAIGDKSGDYLYSGEYGAGDEPPDYIYFAEDDQTFYVKSSDIFEIPYPLGKSQNKFSTGSGGGTVSVDVDSNTVTCSETIWYQKWTSHNYIVMPMPDNDNPKIYQIESFNGGTESSPSNTLTLTEPFEGWPDSVSDVDYYIGHYLWYGHGHYGKFKDYEEYTNDHLGLPEWGTKHASEPIMDGLDWMNASYRLCCAANSRAGWVLAVHVMGLKSLWNHDALFDYQDRFMSINEELVAEKEIPAWQRQDSTFSAEMWDTYRADYGPVWSANPSDPNNPTPELQAIGDKLVDENVALIFDVNATDPNNDPITYSAQGLPSGAMFDPLTGEFAWTPSYQQAGSFQVTFIASDGNSWDFETITITVNNVNRPPVIGAITDQSVNENSILSLSVEASDPDGQALTYSVSGLPAGAVFASQTLTWTPSYDQAGAFPVTFTADDGQAQDSQPITITVINVNRTPVLAAINNQSVWADDPLTFTIDATDPDGDAVTYSAGTLPSGATFTGQDFDWTPSQGQMGSYDVTFIASDGQLQDSQMVTITVDVDSLAPTISNSLPTAGSIQAPLNNLINLNITDAGKGIDADTVTINVNNNTVYAGDTNHYTSPDGECRRLGNKADYRFVYQSNEEFDYDQTVSITVNATDLAGNVMSENSYSFVTEMRSFGQNMMVNSGSVNLNSGRPVTVRDSSGNIWAAWHAGPIDNRDIYIGKLAAGEENFGGTVQLTDNTTDQCNPAVALDSSDKLYVVWQDNREGDWDIYVSTSVDGISWTTETRVNDPNDGDQVNPAIVIDGQSPNQAYVVWQDDRAGSQNICVATSSDGFVTTTVSQITSHISDQVEPAIAADSGNTIYVVWTDTRNNGKKDIYGAASNNGPWTNVPVVTEDDGQSSPAIAAEAVGSILHLVWVDNRLGDDDIYYDKTIGGLSPLTGRSIIDDTTGADQISPVIITTAYTGDLKVFACWRDERNADADLYFVEIGSDNETNVFVGDDGTSTDQSEPAIGIDGDGYPYLVWTNERTDICYAGSTFVEPVALASTNVSISSTATVGTVWNAVNSLDDVSAEVPQGAYLCDVKITISRIKNPPKSNLELDHFSGTYEFGPSGMDFIEPVTITIPYEVNGSENVLYTAYWYNPLTDTLSQQGITDVETIVISSTLHAARFKTTHFSAFILGGGVAAALGGGGGGCSVSAGSEGNMVEFALPYIGLCIVMAILKVRDARHRKARNT